MQCNRSPQLDFLTGGLQRKAGGKLGSLLANAALVMIYRAAKTSGTTGGKNTSELHEPSCYGSITRACNRLTFQTHTREVKAALSRAGFMRKHTMQGDQHMLC